MISHVYLCAVLMLAALPSVCSQCTTSRCQDSKYEPPRWENGAVYLESLLTVTSERILSAVESRLIELTANMATSHAQLTASIESRLAQHAEAVDDRLATLKTELEHSTTSRLEALEERMVVENRNVTTNSEYRLNLTIGAMMNNMEERMVVETRNLANNSEARLNLTFGAMMNNMESHLAEYTEAVDARLTTLKTELENATTDRLEALGERMVVENRNLVTSSETRLNLTIGAMMNTVERRLADQTGTMESRLAVLTGTIESRLVQQAEAVNKRLATLVTDLKNTTTDRLESLGERMVVENRNLANNSESRLNLTIGAMINNMEGRMVVENRDVTINSESRLNLTIGATINSMEASLTTLCSSRGSDQLIAAVYNMSKAQLHILRLLESRVPLTFLRRVDGSVNFTRDWADYRSGFGGPSGEFWLGLEALHQLTTQHEYGLRVYMEDFSGDRKWASYQSFRVGSQSGNYVLTVSGYKPDSTAGDSMAVHNGMEFTTVDRDNDGARRGNCATFRKGGWWYQHCHHALPTGLYKPAGYRGEHGINWYHAYSDWRSFKSMTLKLVSN